MGLVRRTCCREKFRRYFSGVDRYARTIRLLTLFTSDAPPVLFPAHPPLYLSLELLYLVRYKVCRKLFETRDQKRMSFQLTGKKSSPPPICFWFCKTNCYMQNSFVLLLFICPCCKVYYLFLICV